VPHPDSECHTAGLLLSPKNCQAHCMVFTQMHSPLHSMQHSWSQHVSLSVQATCLINMNLASRCVCNAGSNAVALFRNFMHSINETVCYVYDINLLFRSNILTCDSTTEMCVCFAAVVCWAGLCSFCWRGVQSVGAPHMLHCQGSTF